MATNIKKITNTYYIQTDVCHRIINGKKTDTFLVFNLSDYDKEYLLFPLSIDN